MQGLVLIDGIIVSSPSPSRPVQVSPSPSPTSRRRRRRRSRARPHTRPHPRLAAPSFLSSLSSRYCRHRPGLQRSRLSLALALLCKHIRRRTVRLRLCLHGKAALFLFLFIVTPHPQRWMKRCVVVVVVVSMGEGANGQGEGRARCSDCRRARRSLDAVLNKEGDGDGVKWRNAVAASSSLRRHAVVAHRCAVVGSESVWVRSELSAFPE